MADLPHFDEEVRRGKGKNPVTAKEESQTDYYTILRVTRSASADEIRAAYREIAKAYHPDSNFYNEIVKEESIQPDLLDKFKEITAAYNVLMNPDKRSAYDSTLPPLVDSGEVPSSSKSEGSMQRGRSNNTGIFSRQGKAKNNHTVVMLKNVRHRFGSTSSKLKRELSVQIESVGELLGIRGANGGDPLTGLSPLILCLGLITCMALGALLVVILRALL